MKAAIAIQPENVTDGAENTSSARWVLGGLSLCMLLSSLGTSIANVALPTLSHAFAASFQQVQWVVLAYLLAVTTLIVSVGRLGDIVGRRYLLLAGIGLFTVASVLCGVAPSLGLLIAARALQGLGAAVMMALTMAFVGGTVPPSKTGSAMGLLGAMSAVGTALGPSLGGVLIAESGWRAIFYINAPLGIVALMAMHRFLPVDSRSTQEKPRGFDHVGTILLTLILSAYALAMTIGRGHFGPLNTALLLFAGLGAALFAWTESKAVSPLIELEMFRNSALSAGFAMSTLVTTVVMATLVVGPFYLSGALAQGAVRVGLIMAAGPVVAALTGLPAGRCVDRFGAGRMTAAGLIAMLAGCSMLPLMPVRFGVVGYIGPIVILTAGYALFQAANNTAVMTGIPAHRRGVVAGLLNLSRNLGLITGAAAMGSVFAHAAGATGTVPAGPAAVVTGMRLTFLAATILIFCALVIALAVNIRSWQGGPSQ